MVRPPREMLLSPDKSTATAARLAPVVEAASGAVGSPRWMLFSLDKAAAERLLSEGAAARRGTPGPLLVVSLAAAEAAGLLGVEAEVEADQN